VRLLDVARAFYVAFFLAHAEKVTERVPYFSEHHQEMRERLIATDKLLTWAEFQTVETAEHPHPLPAWNFSRAFPDFPFIYRRSVIKDAIGKVRSYLSNLANWQHSGKKWGKPGLPGSSNHPTLYEGAFSLELDGLDLRRTFVRLKVYDGKAWTWVNYPVKYSRYFEQRRTEEGWEQQSPKLILRPNLAELHICQTKEIRAKKQWQSGKAVKGERSNLQLWRHIRRQNTDAAHKTARAIGRVCAKYPGCILLFERLRKIKPKEGSKSHRLNRRQANQLRGQINRLAREKAFAESVVTVEVNPWGTSQHCSRCGAKGERFSYRAGQRVKERGGKLFSCPVCSYEVQADYNASINLHRSFYGEFCWQRKRKSTQGSGPSP
jgi:Putative transposase DNA-binding domain